MRLPSTRWPLPLFMIVAWDHRTDSSCAYRSNWLLPVLGAESRQVRSSLQRVLPIRHHGFFLEAGLFGMMATKTGPWARRLAYLIIQRVGAGYSRLPSRNHFVVFFC